MQYIAKLSEFVILIRLAIKSYLFSLFKDDWSDYFTRSGKTLEFDTFVFISGSAQVVPLFNH